MISRTPPTHWLYLVRGRGRVRVRVRVRARARAWARARGRGRARVRVLVVPLRAARHQEEEAADDERGHAPLDVVPVAPPVLVAVLEEVGDVRVERHTAPPLVRHLRGRVLGLGLGLG